MSLHQAADNVFVLATAADNEMQDQWILDEEWVLHIRNK
jgi:hypothetical protein